MSDRPAWYRGPTPRAVLAAIVLTGFAVATQGLLTRGQSEELRVARAFLTAVYAGDYDVAAGYVDPEIDWMDDADELQALVQPFVDGSGGVLALTAASAQRPSDEVREFVYCLDGAQRDVAGRVEVSLEVPPEEPRVLFLSRFYSPEPCDGPAG